MKPEVKVYAVWAVVDENGIALDSITIREEPTTPEHAHRLAEAPEVSIRVQSAWGIKGRMVAMSWQVAAVGFIEAEAIDAYDAAVEELLLNLSAHQPWSAAV